MIQSGNSCRIEKQCVAMPLVEGLNLTYFAHLHYCECGQPDSPGSVDHVAMAIAHFRGGRFPTVPNSSQMAKLQGNLEVAVEAMFGNEGAPAA